MRTPDPQNPTRVISATIRTDLIDRVDAMARSRDLSRSWIISEALKTYFDGALCLADAEVRADD